MRCWGLEGREKGGWDACVLGYSGVGSIFDDFEVNEDLSLLLLHMDT